MRLLIVEEAPAEAERLANLVATQGHDPFLAPSAEAALASLAVAAPDAVLLDLVLPGMSGFDLLRLLRRRPLPVVAMSGTAGEADARRCLELGAVEFLPKPLTPDRLGMVLILLETQFLPRPARRETWSDRRRHTRIAATFAVTLEDLAGGRWLGQAADVSPFGVRLSSSAQLDAGRTARLSLGLPDGDRPVGVRSLLVRRDLRGLAFAFVDLTAPGFQRLKHFVDARRHAMA